MMVLVTYDVETSSDGGTKRLRRVAKICKDYGQRVQNSVFECVINSAQLVSLKAKLVKEIDKERDSLRFYRLGKNWDMKVEHIGAKTSYNPEEDILII